MPGAVQVPLSMKKKRQVSPELEATPYAWWQPLTGAASGRMGGPTQETVPLLVLIQTRNKEDSYNTQGQKSGQSHLV